MEGNLPTTPLSPVSVSLRRRGDQAKRAVWNSFLLRFLSLLFLCFFLSLYSHDDSDHAKAGVFLSLLHFLSSPETSFFLLKGAVGGDVPQQRRDNGREREEETENSPSADDGHKKSKKDDDKKERKEERKRHQVIGEKHMFDPSVYTPEVLQVSSEEPLRFMFGSCNLQPTGGEWQVNEEDRLMWSFLSRRKPKLFAWLGDTVYAHNYRHFTLSNSIRWRWSHLTWRELRQRRQEVSRAFHKPAPLEEMRQAFYNQTHSIPYQQFLKTGVKIVATYDDHDLGADNPSKSHPLKYEARDLVLDFFNVAKDSPRRSVYWDGMYSSHKLQVDQDLSFRFILLDARFNRDSWRHLPHGDILGEQQWRWLEKELEKSREDRDAVTFIASSIQILPSPFVSTEAWAYFPTARRRLLDLVMNSGVNMPVLLSGDVHFSEMTGVLCRPVRLLPSSSEEQRRTSSSIRHSDKENRRRISPIGREEEIERRDTFLTASSSLRLSDVSSGQCRVLSPWQEMSLLLSHLKREKNLVIKKEKRPRSALSPGGDVGNFHSKASRSSLTKEGEEKNDLELREKDADERGIQREEQDEEDEEGERRNDEEEEMRRHRHSSLLSSLFPRATGSSLEDEDDFSSSSRRRRTTSWNPPGLLERLFPRMSFLSSYVFMYLFGPSISTSFSLLSTSFPHHLLDLYLHGDSEEQAGTEEQTARRLLKKKLRELSVSYRRYHERRTRTHGNKEMKDESGEEAQDELEKKSEEEKKQKRSSPMDGEKEEEFNLQEENDVASQKDHLATSDDNDGGDREQRRATNRSRGDSRRREDEKEEDRRERRKQHRQIEEDLLLSSGDEDDLDWVELREFTSSGLTHGIEETFVQATTLANLAEYGLKKLFPRTSTVKDDFYGDRLIYTHRNVAEIQVLRNPLFHLSSPSVSSTSSSTLSTTKEEEARRSSEQSVISSTSETSWSLPSIKEDDKEAFSLLLSQLGDDVSHSSLIDHCEMYEGDKPLCSDTSRLCEEMNDQSQVSEKKRRKKKEDETEKREVQQGREKAEEKGERVQKRAKRDEMKTSPWRNAVEFFKASSNRFDFLLVLLQRFLELHAVAREEKKKIGEERDGMKEEEKTKKKEIDLQADSEGNRQHQTHKKRKLNIPPRSSWGACDSRKTGRIDREEERSLKSTIFCWKDPVEDEESRGSEPEKRDGETEEVENRKDLKERFESSHEDVAKSKTRNSDISPGVRTRENHRSHNRDNTGNVEYSNRPQSPHYPLLQDAKFFSLLFSVEELLHRTLIGMADDLSSSRKKIPHDDKRREEKEEEREEGGFLSSAWSESIHNYCSLISSDSRQALSSLLKYLGDQKEEKERSLNRKQGLWSRRRQHEVREEDKGSTSHHQEDFSSSLKFLQFRDLLSRTLQDQFCQRVLVSQTSSSTASEEKKSRKAAETMENAKEKGGQNNKEKRGEKKKEDEGKTGENEGHADIQKHQRGVLRGGGGGKEGDRKHVFFLVSVRSFLMALEQGVARQAYHEKRGPTGEISSSLKSYFSFFYKNKSLVSCRRRIHDLHEILRSRLWLAIRIFALPFGDLVLECFLSPYQFQSKRRKLLSQLEEKAQLYTSDSRDQREDDSRSPLSSSTFMEDPNGDRRERNAWREPGVIKQMRGEEEDEERKMIVDGARRIDGTIGWTRRSYVDDEYMRRRARWVCVPLRGQDHSLMYVALSLLIFFLSFLCFTYLCFHSCWTCCCRRRRKRSRKGINATTIETREGTNRQLFLVKNVVKKLD